MSIEAFFASVLPPDGPYVLAHKQKQATGMKHACFKSFAKMAEKSAWYASIGADCWLWIASALDVDYLNDKGKKVPRNQKNVSAIKSLILDLDVSTKDGYYASKEEALLGLFAFQTALGLPDPTVVDSGYGYHVWWSFTEAVPRMAWQEGANLLKQAAKVFDSRLIADPTRVADSASLLRVPETLNFKGAEPVPTSILALAPATLSCGDYCYKLERFLESKGVERKKEIAPREKKEKVETNSLSLFIDEPHSFPAVVKKCNWVKQYLLTQKDASEPEWYAVLGLTPFLEAKGKGPLDLAQFVSKGHPGYTAEGTERKFHQVEKAQQGPTLCERFRSLNSSRCEGCAFAVMVNTPVRLDMVDLPAAAPIISQEIIRESGETVMEQVQLLAPPKPYHRGAEGTGIYVTVGEGEESVVKRIYEYDIFPVRRLKDEETDNEMLEISLTLPMDGHRFIKLPNGLLTDPKKFTAELANKGVLVQTKEAASLTAYIIEYARKIQREEKAHEEFARFGWRDVDGDNPRFILGDFVVDTKGELRRATPAAYLKNVKDVISVRGDLNHWREGFNVYAGIPGGEPLKFALMMAFAAPLLALTSFNGLMYNMLGDSGCGKSTALKIMSSVWGKPNEHHLQVHDNRIPMFNTIGYLQSIPVTFDELTTIPSDVLADIAYAITEGRGKNRADRSGNTRVNTVQWKTVVCGTSNSSLYEKLGMSRSGNNAHAYRIFEAVVNPADLKYRPFVDAALAKVEANYGIAGRLFIIHVIKNLPAVREAILNATVEFAKRFNMPTAERFWFTLFACVAVGGAIAKELGLHSYDIEEIITWVALSLAKVREIVTTVEGDAFSTFAHFLQSNLSSTVIVRDHKSNGLEMGGQFRAITVRLEYEDGKPTFGFVSVPALREFVKHVGIEYGWMLKRLQDGNMVTDIVNKRMGEDTEMLTGEVKCWKVDLQHPAIQGTHP